MWNCWTRFSESGVRSSLQLKIDQFNNRHSSLYIQRYLQNNFLESVSSIQQVLRLWNSRMLSLERTIIIFKALAISKIVYLTFLTVIPNSVMKELQKIYKTFICSKIYLKTLCKYFENGGLKHVDLSSKIISS